MFSRRNHISVIFEIHRVPIGLSSESTEFFSFYINNSSAIIIFKFLGDNRQVKLFKSRFFHNNMEALTKAEILSQKISENSSLKFERSYIVYQKDFDIKFKRLLRVDIFGLNIVHFLD